MKFCIQQKLACQLVVHSIDYGDLWEQKNICSIMFIIIYNPNNIFVWKEDTDSIPEDFLNTSYQELSEPIYKKYSQENWVKTIFNIWTT